MLKYNLVGQYEFHVNMCDDVFLVVACIAVYNQAIAASAHITDRSPVSIAMHVKVIFLCYVLLKQMLHCGMSLPNKHFSSFFYSWDYLCITLIYIFRNKVTI